LTAESEVVESEVVESEVVESEVVESEVVDWLTSRLYTDGRAVMPLSFDPYAYP
jgi:hypothetical protein